MYPVANEAEHPLAGQMSKFIEAPHFPCVGAKAALKRDGMNFLVARNFGSAWDDLRILPALLDLSKRYRAQPTLFQSLVVIFEAGAPISELQFERLLWERLISLSDKDEWLGQPPDSRVAHDPDDPHFAMSFGGEAFFVVGLHPRASRPARRFDFPAIVFNLHDQFEQLRQQGRYDKLRDAITERDISLAGSSNPMLSVHGAKSSARQYSGRVVEENWQCPFAGRGSY